MENTRWTLFDPRRCATRTFQHVRFGSLADVCSAKVHVRQLPIADMRPRDGFAGAVFRDPIPTAP
jgi:hypothetical protein